MIPSSPIQRFRPTRTDDDEGGYLEVLADEITIWGLTKVHEAQVSLVIDSMTDLTLGDLLEIGNLGISSATGQYRVTGFKEVAGQPLMKEAMLNKVDKPIRPMP